MKSPGQIHIVFLLQAVNKRIRGYVFDPINRSGISQTTNVQASEKKDLRTYTNTENPERRLVWIFAVGLHNIGAL